MPGGLRLVPGEGVRAAAPDQGAITGNQLCGDRFGPRGGLITPGRRAIQHPDQGSPVFEDALAARAVIDVLTTVIGANIKSMQSMYLIKSEGSPGQAWHQDEHFIPTRDRSLTAAWIAIDDATVENGCRWVIPGSHRRGIRCPDRDCDDTRFDCMREAYGFPYRDEDAVPSRSRPGASWSSTAICCADRCRIPGGTATAALVNHYMSAESLLPGNKPTGGFFGEYDFRDIVMVAGEDPHAYKGLVDFLEMASRPDRQGGCDR